MKYSSFTNLLTRVFISLKWNIGGKFFILPWVQIRIFQLWANCTPEFSKGVIVHLDRPAFFIAKKQSCLISLLQLYWPSSVAQLDAPSDWRPGGRGFNPRRGWQHSFVEIDHEIFSTVILSLLLIQEGQLSVSVRKNVHNTG